MLEWYDTVAGEGRHEIDKIKGSRFIGSCAPVANEADARAFLDRIRAEFADARHHGSAWRLGADGATFRYDDDGEPSGSTGQPILRQIDGAGLTGIVVVVTRYFGGTKLGVGGLVRAYGAAAAAVLEATPHERVSITRGLRVAYPYECEGAVQGVLAAAGLEPLESHYGEGIRMRFQVPVARVDAFRQELTDRTGGRAEIREDE